MWAFTHSILHVRRLHRGHLYLATVRPHSSHVSGDLSPFKGDVRSPTGNFGVGDSSTDRSRELGSFKLCSDMGFRHRNVKEPKLWQLRILWGGFKIPRCCIPCGDCAVNPKNRRDASKKYYRSIVLKKRAVPWLPWIKFHAAQRL